MLNLTWNAAKSNFFDRDKVKRQMDATTLKFLRIFGSAVRLRSRHSIRKRRGVSRPGRPPHSHVGLLRTGIFFAYDGVRKTVVIGPALLRPGSQVPRLLEYGGFGRRLGKNKKVVKAFWRARPYMNPAFRAELKQMDKHWRNTWQKG